MIAVALVAAAAGAFVQLRLGQPRPPDPARWLLVPVSPHELPPDLMAEAGYPDHPGLLLAGSLQIAARGVDGRGDQTIRFSATLAEGATLHTFFGARGLAGRDQVSGTSLFLSRISPPELFQVQGPRLTRLPCAVSPRTGPGLVQVTIELRGVDANIAILSAGHTSHISWKLDPGSGRQVGFRVSQAAVVLGSVRVEDARGELLLEHQASGGIGQRLVVAALTLGAVLLLWLLEAALFGWLLGRGMRAGLVLAAWTALPLLLLPLLFWADMGALAHGLRLARTSTLALRLGLVVSLVTLVRALALLIHSRRLRCRERELEAPPAPLMRLLSHRQVQVSGLALAAHGVCLTALALTQERGVLAAVGLEAAPVWEALATLAAALAVPWASLLLGRWLVPGHGVKLAAVEALSWAPSLAAGALALALTAAGALQWWNTPAHLLAAALASLVFKLLFLQVNARAVRCCVNGLSLACVLLIALAAEGTARLTYLDRAWSPTPPGRLRAHASLGWSRADKEFDYIINKKRPTRYPRDSYPVAFPGRAAGGATRIVCLGGSSTGGAFQMDDLDSFFPAELQRYLDRRAGRGRYEVLNQGVGGWNTFHIRLYIESAITRLRPDILILYVGHNDIMTTGSETYRQLWNRYRMQRSSLKGVVDVLNGSRLFVGYRTLLEALRHGPGGERVSHVPLNDARDNLERIIQVAGAGTHVVLLSEAINTADQTLVSYRRMLADVAARHRQHFLDTNGLFWKARQDDLFLDRNHLSQRGHRRLARWLGELLVAQKLVRLR